MTEQPDCEPTVNKRHLFVGAVLVPMMLAAANDLTLRFFARFENIEEAFVFSVLLVGQLIFVAWVLCSLRLSLWLKTTIYVWWLYGLH